MPGTSDIPTSSLQPDFQDAAEKPRETTLLKALEEVFAHNASERDRLLRDVILTLAQHLRVIPINTNLYDLEVILAVSTVLARWKRPL